MGNPTHYHGTGVVTQIFLTGDFNIFDSTERRLLTVYTTICTILGTAGETDPHPAQIEDIFEYHLNDVGTITYLRRVATSSV